LADLLIRGGTVVTPAGEFRADVAVVGEQIAAVGRLDEPAARTIDASGMLVLPGLVDAHVHMQLASWDAVTANDWYRGTVAAALGGVTTVIDFATQSHGRPLMEAVERRRLEADGNTVIDYGLHMVVTDAAPDALREVDEVVRSGIPGFKLYMTYRAYNVMSDDDDILRVCHRVQECGGLPGVHAENTSIAEGNYARFLAEGLQAPRYHALAKPDYVEAEAINRALFLARVAGSRLYIYHLSTALGADFVRRARQEGQPVFAETCPHYLTLTRELLERPDGVNWLCSPPLRDAGDQQALWAALADGTVSVISTDEAGFNAADKANAAASCPLEAIPNGLPGVELRLPLLFTEGVLAGRVSLPRFVALNCENPARVFGLYPRKGAIAPGSDADLIVVDPHRQVVLDVNTQHMPVDWCAYEGKKVWGYPAYTVSRGEVVVSNYAFSGLRGRGSFVPGKIEGGHLEPLS
jgi:dihydropyrimidinase